MALRIGGGVEEGEMPVKDKSELVATLHSAITTMETFCKTQGIDFQAIMAAQGFERIKQLDDAVDTLVADDETKKKYLAQANTIAQLYKAILPDLAASAYSAIVALVIVIARKDTPARAGFGYL